MGLVIQDALNNQVKNKWVWLTLHVDLHVDVLVPKTFGVLVKMEHHVSSIVRALSVTVASSMFTQRAGTGSAEARKAGANGARIEGQSRECVGSETRRCGIVIL